MSQVFADVVIGKGKTKTNASNTKQLTMHICYQNKMCGNTCYAENLLPDLVFSVKNDQRLKLKHNFYIFMVANLLNIMEHDLYLLY